MAEAGRLWLVATPIGNLDDFGPRAIEVLKSVAVIACEDTRHSGPLLMHFGIHTPTMALHDHNEEELSDRLIARMQKGESIAVISDAGTPAISDPGFRLVRAASAQGIVVSAVPGPCALIMALSISGLPTDRFRFEGFLPAKASARLERLSGLVNESATVVCYESKHRILETLDDVLKVFGPTRQLVLARELTKTFETVLRGNVESVREQINQDVNQTKGEFVLVLEGAHESEDAKLAEARRLYAALLAELPPARAAKVAAKLTGVAKNRLYGGALSTESDEPR